MIAYNDQFSRWDLIPASQNAINVSYDNTASGLAANNVQNAIDQVDAAVDTNTDSITDLQDAVAGLGAGIVYRGQLDVSAGDSALPSAPSGGDLYSISTGGTITVSVNGQPSQSTAVVAGQQIIYNSQSTAWDLIGFIAQAASVGYDNATSGLDANNVQDALDEAATGLVGLVTANFNATIVREQRITDVTKDSTNDIDLTIDDSSFDEGDIIRIRKTAKSGVLTIDTTNDQVDPDGVTDTQSQFPDGSDGTVELILNGAQWALRVY